MRIHPVDPEVAGWGRTTIGPWTRHSRRVVYENPWLALYHDEVSRPDGSAGIYGVVHFQNVAVGVLPLDADDRVALVGQHRYPLDGMSWEIPEGGAPHAEDPIVGAKRELREETGLEATDWRELGRYELSNSVSDERAVVFVATGLTAGTANPDPTEELTIRWVPFAEAVDMVIRGEIADALSVMALQALALERTRT